MEWNALNIFDARDHNVRDRTGKLHMVRLYSDGWKVGDAEGLDVWQAVRLLNEIQAEAPCICTPYAIDINPACKAITHTL